MPRGVALTAGLLLLILAGIATGVGLFRPRELEPAPWRLTFAHDPVEAAERLFCGPWSKTSAAAT